MKRYTLTIATLLLMILGSGDLFAQMGVRLQQPPPNQLKVADMWKITVVNSSREKRRVYLQGTATESRDGEVVNAQSAQFDLAPGTRTITGRDVEPVKVNSSNSKYKNIVLQTGSVPSGTYTICVYVKDAKTGETLGSDCITQTVQNVSLVLINPSDETRLTEALPRFTWTTTPLMNPSTKYSIRIVEIIGNQSPVAALQSGRAFHENEEVRGMFYQYPVSAPRMVSGKEYAWQVSAFSNGVMVSQSEVWTFSYGNDLQVVPPKNIISGLPAKFQKAFGGTGIDQAYSIRQTKDSGYIIAGYTNSFGAGRDDAYLIKTDPAGVLQWSKTYGGAEDDIFYGVEQTTDGGYIAVGCSRSFEAVNNDVYVVKTDASGGTQWSRTYGGGSDDAGFSVDQAETGGYVVAGILGTGDDYDGYVIRLASNGLVTWSRNIGGEEYDVFRSVRQVREGFLAAGSTRTYGKGNDDAYVALVRDDGQVQWTTSIGTLFMERGYSVVDAPGRFVVAGYGSGKVSLGYDIHISAIDRGGSLIWSKFYEIGPIDEGFSAAATQNGEIVVAGNTRGPAQAGKNGVYMFKVGTDGSVQWSKFYQGANLSDGMVMTRTFDQGYAIAGWTNEVGNGDALLVKTDMEGKAGCNELDPKVTDGPSRMVAGPGMLFGLGANAAVASTSTAPASTVETVLCPK